jgi:hypothetical protein
MEFSLIVFRMDPASSREEFCSRVALRAARMMREIDHVGWLDGRTIGVLLPATSIQGGRKFAGRVAAPAGPGGMMTDVESTTNPGEWMLRFMGEHAEDAGRGSRAAL